MPILVKDYTWVQSENMVNIRVPLTKNSYHDNVDLFTTDIYVKANFNPFLFEVFLLREVDSKKSKCIVKDEMIVLDLLKKEPGEWEKLEKDLTKAEKMQLRQEIIDKNVEKAVQEREDKRIRKSELDRFTVQRAMDIDAKQHEIMDSRRNAERDTAMAALEEWRQNTDNPTPVEQPSLPVYRSILEQAPSTATVTELPDDYQNDKEATVVGENEDKDTEKRSPLEEKADKPSAVQEEVVKKSPSEAKVNGKPTQKPPVRKSPKPVKTPVKSEYIEKKKQEHSKRELPRLREFGSVEIKHTPRTFPTPTRESAQEEEQAWLKNMTLARRATGFVSEDLRPEEQDPQWCKDKGDEFFRSGNFLGAISAYSHGITLSDKLPSLYSNRAATHFALGNFNKCINDCTTAMDLMKPACEGNRRSRAKCIARRAAALARLGYLNKAINEMKAALNLVPDDEMIKKDIYDMERAWEQNPDDG